MLPETLQDQIAYQQTKNWQPGTENRQLSTPTRDRQACNRTRSICQPTNRELATGQIPDTKLQNQADLESLVS